MENKKSYRYIQFPVCLLSDMFKNKRKTINDIIDYGVFNFSTKMTYKIEDVARQSIYFYYRKPELVKLRKMIDKLDSELIGLDECYNGFSGDTFDPIDEQRELLRHFEENEELREHCINLYRLHCVCQILMISAQLEAMLKRAIDITERLPKATQVIENPSEVTIISNKKEKGLPTATAKITTLLDFRDDDKTDYELEQYVAYLAINSIIGKSTSKFTNYDHIRARMFGFAKASLITEEVKRSELFIKYLKSYRMKKLMKALELNWKILTYSKHMRGLHVCYSTKMTMYQLSDMALEKKAKNKEAKLANEKRRATDDYYRRNKAV